jgi:hypothetical protein
VSRVERARTRAPRAGANPPRAAETQALQEKARDLLLVADCVAREGWGDTVAAHLRQAAHDLLKLAHPKP